MKCTVCNGKGKIKTMSPASGHSAYVQTTISKCKVCEGKGNIPDPIEESEHDPLLETGGLNPDETTESESEDTTVGTTMGHMEGEKMEKEQGQTEQTTSSDDTQKVDEQKQEEKTKRDNVLQKPTRTKGLRK